jgi:hypothetical protein
LIRSDSTLEIEQVFNNGQIALTQLAQENIFFVFILVLIIIITLCLFFNIKKILVQKKNIIIFAFYFFTFFSFLFTFVHSGQEYEKIKYISYLEKELIFRGNYFYFIFLIPILILKKNLTKFKINNNFFIYLGFIIILFSIYNYNVLRNEFIKDKIEKRLILTNELSKKINLENSIVAYDNYTSAYGLNEGIFFMKGNSAYANDRFDNEIISLYPKYRYFRINDIIANILHNKTKFKTKKNQEIRKKIDEYDFFLKKNLFNSIYKILSYKSYFVYPGNSSNRSDEIYSKQYDKNTPSPHLLMYTNNNLKNLYVDHGEIKKYIENKLPIEDYFEINCKEDTWYVFIVKKKYD